MKSKKTKLFLSRMIPIFIIVLITWILSFIVYQKMIQTEKESCWERLEIATKSTAQKISVRLTDNISFLEAVSDSFVLTKHLHEEKEVGKYLNSIMSMTIFESIDVILPNGDIIKQDGKKINISGQLSYEELVTKGTHISPRCTSPFNNEEVIYCFTPIDSDGQIEAILCGTLSCKTMSEIFEVFTYKENAQLFLIDCADGNYLIDNWHNNLDNIYNLGLRENPKTGEIIDMAPMIINKETGGIFYISHTNGIISYQYHTPVDEFNWQLCVVVQEDVVFEHVKKLQNILYTVGIIEFIIVLAFTLWNMHINAKAINSDEKLKSLELTKATNEAKSRFISNMSHDIRTPLNGIMGMLHIIKNHRENQTLVDDCLRKIEISSQYLTTLTNDMLDINEIESDKFILESLPINLTKLAEDLGIMIEPKAKEKNISYHIEYSNVKNPFVLGSPVHIERVLINLVSNSIKYSKEINANIYVEFQEYNISDVESTYKFIVSDNGIGMSEEFQKDMYNDFAQEKVTARSSYQGYGLGLAIVYRLVKKMNGSIELQSIKNEGSTFTITLPLKHNKNYDPISTNETNTNTNLNGVNILLVEDNEFNMEIAKIILTDAGANVSIAKNGKYAIEMFRKSELNHFDLILMDIMMPEMDGIEATKIIRSMYREDSVSVPIFAMTATTFSEEIKHCIEVGMNEHISKPIDIDKLITLVVKYCKNHCKNGDVK